MGPVSSTVSPDVVARRAPRAWRRPARRTGPIGPRVGYAFVAGYVLLLICFGILPAGYAIYLAFTNYRGQIVGLGNFTRTARDFRFGPAFEHIVAYLIIWMVSLVVLVVLFAVMLHGRRRRTSTVLRFVYYLPGALTGVASLLVWLFMLDPSVSPVGTLLRHLGFSTFAQSIAPGHLPVIFTVIAFWTGAGGWIIVMHGALNNISTDLLEAARIDGANALWIAISIQIPMIGKWIAYMVILAFAAGTQLFVEPQLVSEASGGAVSNSWAPNQLAYIYAFQNNDFNGSAALSIDLLVVGLLCAAVVVFRSGLFDVE